MINKATKKDWENNFEYKEYFLRVFSHRSHFCCYYCHTIISSDEVLSSSAEIQDILDEADGKNDSLIEDAAKSKTDKDSAAIVNHGNTFIDVPKNPEDGISVQIADMPEIEIGLPNADDAKNASRLSDGTVVFPDTDGSANAVIPTEKGVQMITTISSKTPLIVIRIQ